MTDVIVYKPSGLSSITSNMSGFMCLISLYAIRLRRQRSIFKIGHANSTETLMQWEFNSMSYLSENDNINWWKLYQNGFVE